MEAMPPIGTRIVYTVNEPGLEMLFGRRGVLVKSSGPLMLMRFDEEHQVLHSGGGQCDNHHAWYISPSEIELEGECNVEPPTYVMEW